MNRDKDLLDFKNLLHRLETEGREFSQEDDILMGIVSPEKFPYKTRSIVNELEFIIDDNPEFYKMIPDKLKKFFSRNVFPENKLGGNMNKAKKLLGLLEQEKEKDSEKERKSLKKQIDDLHDKLIKMESNPKAEAQEFKDLRDKLSELTAQYNRMQG